MDQCLFVLVLNAIPLYGVRFHGWSGSTVVVLYWFENLLVAAFTCAIIALHRQLTRKRGHWRTGQLGTQVNGKPSTRGLLGEYASLAFVFTAAHGIFVWFFVNAHFAEAADAPFWEFSPEQAQHGANAIAFTLATQFALTAASVRSRSFAWLKDYVEQRSSRVLVMHLTIIFGMFAMLMLHSALVVLYVLIALKTAWELLGAARAATPSGGASGSPTDAPAVATARRGRADDSDSAARARRNALEDEEVLPA